MKDKKFLKWLDTEIENLRFSRQTNLLSSGKYSEALRIRQKFIDLSSKKRGIHKDNTLSLLDALLRVGHRR